MSVPVQMVVKKLHQMHLPYVKKRVAPLQSCSCHYSVSNKKILSSIAVYPHLCD
jgi:hypothetical protein